VRPSSRGPARNGGQAKSGDEPHEPLEPLERVPVAHLTRVGRKISLVLDRPNRKRCELLVVEKPRREGGGGTYEQI
jgi:hypothetical protein